MPRKWNQAHFEQRLQMSKQSALERSRLKTYGITPEQYATLWDVQGRACAICRSSVNDTGRAWHVDHDHDSGFVRGILCHGCNVSLGVSKFYTPEQVQYVVNPPALPMRIAPGTLLAA